MMAKRLIAVSVLILTIMAFAATTTTYASTDKNYDLVDSYRCIHPTSPTIQFVKYERSQSGVRFYYTVKAGSKNLDYLYLTSPVFKTVKLLGASEKVEYNQKFMYIRFNSVLKAGQTKTIWFDLALDYNGFTLGNIPFYIQAGSPYTGNVLGPQSIYTPPHVSTITVTSPNGGESWIRGTTHTITWTSSGSPGANVKIELLKGGSVVKTISSSTANDGSYSWVIPTTQTTGSDYKIKITSTSTTVTDSSNNNFAITAVTLTVTSPNGGESWIRGTTHTITWTSSGSPGANVKIELLKCGSVVKTISSSTANDGSYSWAIPSTQTKGTDYIIRITSTTNTAITDSSNNNFCVK